MLADAPCRQELQAFADDLVEHLDRVAFRMRAHDRQGSTHRQQRIAREMHERAWARAARALRGFQSQDELIAIEPLVGEDFGVFQEDRAAVGAHVRL